MECKLCHKVFNNLKISSLSKHIHNQHKDYDKKTYYDTFLIIDENEGFCKTCNEPTTFRGLDGYATFCSVRCRSLDTNIRLKLSNYAKGKKQSQETIEKRIANTNQETKERNRIASLQERYGQHVTNPSQTPTFKERYKETSLKNWGTEYPTKNPKVFAERRQFRKRTIQINGHTFSDIQGYEDLFLEQLSILFPHVTYDDLLEERGKTLYQSSGHVHFPDFYSKKHNHMFEVKSKWTYEQNKDAVLSKKKEAELQGYKYSIIIWERRTSKPILI